MFLVLLPVKFSCGVDCISFLLVFWYIRQCLERLILFLPLFLLFSCFHLCIVLLLLVFVYIICSFNFFYASTRNRRCATLSRKVHNLFTLLLISSLFFFVCTKKSFSNCSLKNMLMNYWLGQSLSLFSTWISRDFMTPIQLTSKC